MERGLLVMAKRRSALGFYTTEQRLVPAWEIADVCREGSAVRLDLRGGARHRDFFQFWAGDASTAGTIVRLLPTTRTIEYEGPLAASSRETAPPLRSRGAVAVVLAIAVSGLVAVLAAPKLGYRLLPTGQVISADSNKLITPGAVAPAARIAPRPATDLEVVNARAVLSRYDDQFNGLRSQFRTAFTALQYGDLSRDEFTDGLNRWLIPQWRGVYKALSTPVNGEAQLSSDVRKQLSLAALSWDVALREYVRGLQEQKPGVVLGAIGQMSSANEEQSKAWMLIAHSE
jgi:hypothetical protein